jgi:hypothetical protein
VLSHLDPYQSFRAMRTERASNADPREPDTSA